MRGSARRRAPAGFFGVPVFRYLFFYNTSFCLTLLHILVLSGAHGNRAQPGALCFAFGRRVWYSLDMKVYAISDLHLSFAVDKPMDIFGDGWQDHFEKVKADWLGKVTPEDAVLLGGDISWGISVAEAAPDYAALAELPGRKIVLRGNHDYYWSTLSKMRTAFPDFDFVQNNCVRAGNVLVAGSRGWTLPSSSSTPEDAKIYARELERLRLSLTDMSKQRGEDDKVVAMLHYPPFEADRGDTEVTALLEEFKPDAVLYGHLHGKKVRVQPEIIKHGIRYLLTSCDLVKNTLVPVF